MSNTTFAPGSMYDIEIAKFNDLLTLIGSALSGVAIVFTIILYGHYRHLHSMANHMFIFGILVVNLVAAMNYFLCIFTTDERTTTAAFFSPDRCNACGFTEQIHSFAEPFLSTLFWVQIYCVIHKIDVVLFRSTRTVVLTILATWLVGIGTAALALAEGWYSQSFQAWCWIHADITWFKVAFCWMWVATTSVAMVLALANPLCSDTLNATQKRLVGRRAVLGLCWVLVNSIDICARFLRDDAASVVQAICEPMLGLLNVMAFLYSERMMTLRALGLPPGGEPTYGFTAAMRYIPEKMATTDELSVLVSR